MTTMQATVPQVNARHVSRSEIVDSLRPDSVELGTEVLPEIERSGGEYASITKSRVLIKDARNRMAVISSPGGAPGDPHLHDDFNEWWVVYGGEMFYTIGEYSSFVASFGDIVVAPCGYRHDPRAWRGEMCMRMVIGKDGSNHDLKGIPPARTIPMDEKWEPPNRIFTPFDYMTARHGLFDNWSETVILDQRNRVVMHHVLAGEPIGSVTGNEEAWWLVLQGAVHFEIGDDPELMAQRGAVVYAGDGEERMLSAGPDESAICIEVVAP